MAESTISITHDQLRQIIGSYLGYGQTIGNWSAEESQTVENILQAGERQFYFGAFLPGASKVHTWSFLKNCTSTITTTASDYQYTMPDDFAKLSNEVVIQTDDSRWVLLGQRHEGQIRKYRADTNGDVEGTPRVFALRPLAATPSASSGLRYEMLLHPIPDAVYTINYAYTVIAGKTTTALPYPHGGGIHGETIKLSCLAKAELELMGTPGPYKQEYLEALASSISIDREVIPSRNLGRNGGESRYTANLRHCDEEWTTSYQDRNGDEYA